MGTFLFIALLVLGGVAAFFAGDIIGAITRKNAGLGSAYTKEQLDEFEERNRKWREEFEAKNPDGPPISDQEHAAFTAWLDAQNRPAIRLTPAEAPMEAGEVQADGSRLGGPVALAAEQAWPTSRRGNPMEFLAQLDFAALPQLDGFPAEGVLQFFILQDDDLWGMDMDNPQNGDVALLYRPNGAGADVMAPNPPVDRHEANTPFLNNAARDQGIALSAETVSDPIDASDGALQSKFDGNMRRPGFGRWEDLLEKRADEKPLVHHAGGHPVFVQSDFRQPGHLDDYDTVLLRLTSDDHLQWGDVGEANFLIRSKDLAKRDFSKVIFWWDCS